MNKKYTLAQYAFMAVFMFAVGSVASPVRANDEEPVIVEDELTNENTRCEHSYPPAGYHYEADPNSTEPCSAILVQDSQPENQ